MRNRFQNPTLLRGVRANAPSVKEENRKRDGYSVWYFQGMIFSEMSKALGQVVGSRSFFYPQKIRTF